VTLIGAAQLPAVDVTGSSDPYVTIRIGETKVYRTAVIKRTVEPQWNESFEILVDDLDSVVLHMQVKDWNVAQVNKVLGTAAVRPGADLAAAVCARLLPSSGCVAASIA